MTETLSCKRYLKHSRTKMKILDMLLCKFYVKLVDKSMKVSNISFNKSVKSLPTQQEMILRKLELLVLNFGHHLPKKNCLELKRMHL